MKEKLDQLKALQDIQNAQALEGRVVALEESLSALNDTVTELLSTLSQLQMDVHKNFSQLLDKQILTPTK